MNRDVIIGSSVAAAVVAVAFAVVIFIFVRRQWSHSEERKLRLRAHLSGLAYGDDEVFLGCTDCSIKFGPNSRRIVCIWPNTAVKITPNTNTYSLTGLDY